MISIGASLYNLAKAPSVEKVTEAKKHLLKTAIHITLAVGGVFAMYAIAPSALGAVALGLAGACLSLPAASIALGGWGMYMGVHAVTSLAATGIMVAKHGAIVSQATSPIAFKVLTACRLAQVAIIAELPIEIGAFLGKPGVYPGLLDYYVIEPLVDRLVTA